MKNRIIALAIALMALTAVNAQSSGNYSLPLVDSLVNEKINKDPEIEKHATDADYMLKKVDEVYDELKSEYLYAQAMSFFRQPACDDMTSLMKPYLDRITVDSMKTNINKALEKHRKDYGAVFPGQPAPELTMVTTKGKTVKLSDFRGKLLFIDIWGTWCIPCYEEIPYLHKLNEKYKDNKDVVIMSIACDKQKSRQKWLNTLAKHKDMDWQQYQITDESNKVLDDVYHVFGIPRFMIIGPDGKIIDADAQRPSFDTFNEYFEKIVK